MNISRIALVTAALGIAAIPGHAAGLTQLTSPSQLASTDQVALYPTTVTAVTGPVAAGSPYTFTSPTGANTLTFSDNGGFNIDSTDIGFVNENPLTSALIFPQGTTLLDNSPVSVVGTDDQTTINFADPVSDFGLDAFSLDDAQNFTVDAFDGAASLGTFDVDNDPSGINNPTLQFGNPSPDFTPVFLGASASGQDITSVVISSPNDNGAGFVLGPLTSAAVPEPAPTALLGLALCGLLPLALRRRRA